MAANLTAADFPGFFRQAHGHDPFPWQQALASRVLNEGRWPDAVDVPTGLGKTSLIDVAVFAAAARPGLGRRRVFFVVDRRLVVDEAFEHTRALQRVLQIADGGICAQVAAILRQPGDDRDAPVLQVTRMRGGVTWSWRWLDRPDRHAVVTGTIDQVGSRLLFRGYGVGEYLRPVDAALAGTDSLIIVDEAHLAGPFLQTMQDAVTAGQGHTPGPAIITMSATTAPRPGAVVHRIGLEDERPGHEASRRLRAGRRLHLVTAPARPGNPAGELADLMAAWATALAGDPESGRIVAVVCNTVAHARAVFGLLLAAHADTVLLTGRIRPADRDYLLRRGWYDRVRAGRQRTAGPPLILVATQTIEVGANIDADALVTESASLDALVQRLGRLNRLGQLETSPAVVIHDPASGLDDPVYGPARQVTWQWLASLTGPLAPRPRAQPDLPGLGAGLDASPTSLRRLINALDPAAAANMRSREPYVPVLFPATLDAWARTSPAPHPDPPVAPYLHGIGHGAPDVAVAWRADLTGNPDQWEQRISAVPPAAEETLEVPAAAVRHWLSGHAGQAAGIGDMEGSADPDADPAATEGQGHQPDLRVVRYRSSGDIKLITAPEIRPGDTIIVPARLGGCDEFGWNPASRREVTDVADLAYRHGRPLLRLTPALGGVVAEHHPELARAMAGLITRAQQDATEEDGPSAAFYREELAGLIRDIPWHDDEPPLIRNLRTLASSCTALPYLPPGEPQPAGRQLGVLLASRGGGQAGDPEALGSSALGEGGQVSLAGHQNAVARRASEFARNLGLGQQTVASVTMAARLHDEGKRDPRFQAMLRGRPARTIRPGTPLLAKSGMDPADRAAFRQAQHIAGYPAGMRHEALSARITRLVLAGDPAGVDPELVVHLVAAHHGRARPLLPPITDPDPLNVPLAAAGLSLSTDETVDWDGPRRFAELNQRYGRWGLALLETIVRLADIWCSERGEQGEEKCL